MTASAIMMVRIADQTPAVAASRCGDLLFVPLSEATSWYAIQTSIRPPTSCRPGIFNSHTTASVATTRSTMAPTVPQMIALVRIGFGSLRAASAITMALSPASTRSMTMIANSAVKKSAESQSMAITL